MTNEDVFMSARPWQPDSGPREERRKSELAAFRACRFQQGFASEGMLCNEPPIPLRVLDFLGARDLLRLSLVCKSTHQAAHVLLKREVRPSHVMHRSIKNTGYVDSWGLLTACPMYGSLIRFLCCRGLCLHSPLHGRPFPHKRKTDPFSLLLTQVGWLESRGINPSTGVNVCRRLWKTACMQVRCSTQVPVGS
jgi:hypothetical protein